MPLLRNAVILHLMQAQIGAFASTQLKEGSIMTKEDIIGKVLNANQEQLTTIANALGQKATPAQQDSDRKILSTAQASRVLGVSRATVWRLTKEGKLKTVETRMGRKRILSQSITDFISGANNA